MKQVICDKCKKVLKEEDFGKITSIPLPYMFSAREWQYKKFDLCDDCIDKLNKLIEQTKCDFIANNKLYNLFNEN